MDTGGPIVGCHDGSDDSLCLGDSPRSGVWDVNILLPDACRGLLVEAFRGLKVCTLLMSAVLGLMTALERRVETNAEWVFPFSELVNKVAGVTPKRKVGVVRRSVKGGSRTVLIVAVEEISGIVVSRAG